ncbi:MAG: LON peptidase substrate-binding domain-containing protein, partial [Pseudomonadales bacterium]|nr:LON peptidase substrate-binding domain-containing protein [Pseudomonadales bacterium]
MFQSLPVLPLKDTVVYPNIVVPLAVGRPRSLAAIEAAMKDNREFIAVAQRSPDVEDPKLEDLYQIGTIAKITRVENRNDGAQVIVQGDRRVRLISQFDREDYLMASAEYQVDLKHTANDAASMEIDALLRVNRELAQRIANLYDSENGAQMYQQLVGHLKDPVIQMYRIASLANLSLEHEQAILDCQSTLALMQQVNGVLSHELRVTELRREIAEQARDDIEQQQREHVLRQQKQAIEHALGENGEDEDIG